MSGYFSTRYTQLVSGEEARTIWADGTIFQADEQTGNYAKISTVTGEHGLTRISFALSRGNSIYGQSSTVQPAAISLIPQIRF